MRKITNLGNSPNVLDTDQLHKTASLHPKYQQLVRAVTNGDSLPPQESSISQRIFAEISTGDGLILLGNKIILPDALEHIGDINVRTKMLDIAHENHPRENAMKLYIRSRFRFSKMDEEISKITQGCLVCQVTKTRNPLIPFYLPKELWEKFAVHHWGPTADGYFLLFENW